jgi:hypothetical protein
MKKKTALRRSLSGRVAPRIETASRLRRALRYLGFLNGLCSVADNVSVVVRTGGGSGIRTHDTVSRIHAFQACAFSHSATPPESPRNIAARISVTTRPVSTDEPALTQPGRGTFAAVASYFHGLRRRQGGRHGTRAIAMAPRHSAADHSSDLGAWRPARLILPGDASCDVE